MYNASDISIEPRVIWQGVTLRHPDTLGRIVVFWYDTKNGTQGSQVTTEILVINAMGEESWVPAASYACPVEDRQAMDGVFLCALARDLDRHRAVLPTTTPPPVIDPRSR